MLINLVITKEQVEGMWERLAAAMSNVAEASRFRKILLNFNLGFVYNQVN